MYIHIKNGNFEASSRYWKNNVQVVSLLNGELSLTGILLEVKC